VRLAELAATSELVAATRSRREKLDLLAGALAGLDPGEARAGVAFLAGELRQGRIGVGWKLLADLPPQSASAEPLTVADVDAAFERIAAVRGAGANAARRAELETLFARASDPERRFLIRLIGGELRQGALEGLLVQALAAAVGAPADAVRRAVMLHGDVGPVAEAALADGPAALDRFRLEVGRPLRPMLASPAAGVEDAMTRLGQAGAEWKLDGARIQIHRDGDDVRVFTRSLDDVTARVPELVEAALALPARTLVLDGEAIALRADGRPQPFQVTAARFASHRERTVPLSPFLFDVLHADGEDVLDRPGAERAALLAELVPEDRRIPRVAVADAAGAQAVLDEALARGHEGIMLKALDVPYAAGSRGAGWLKVKPVHTLDLVVLAAEWGHGRRQGWLSNLHLGARDPRTGGFVMLGKTFKGLTDAMLAWQTEHLLALETGRERHVVHVRPELVVEVAFDGIQTSPRYPGGVALRFARVVRHRPDKPATEADTIEAVLATRAGAAPEPR